MIERMGAIQWATGDVYNLHHVAIELEGFDFQALHRSCDMSFEQPENLEIYLSQGRVRVCNGLYPRPRALRENPPSQMKNDAIFDDTIASW